MTDTDRYEVVGYGADVVPLCDSFTKAKWIPVSERLPEIATEGVSVTVIAAHVGYDLTMQGFVRTGGLRSSPADYIGRDENGPWFKSMVNGRRLDAVAWMPMPEPPPECP